MYLELLVPAVGGSYGTSAMESLVAIESLPASPSTAPLAPPCVKFLLKQAVQ